MPRIGQIFRYVPAELNLRSGHVADITGLRTPETHEDYQESEEESERRVAEIQQEGEGAEGT